MLIFIAKLQAIYDTSVASHTCTVSSKVGF